MVSKIMRNRDDIPKAARFELGFCSEPNCGPHIIGIDANEKPMCEIVISRHAAVEFIMAMQDGLYGKAVERDDK
jgi:hypothetical protein